MRWLAVAIAAITLTGCFVGRVPEAQRNQARLRMIQRGFDNLTAEDQALLTEGIDGIDRPYKKSPSFRPHFRTHKRTDEDRRR